MTEQAQNSNKDTKPPEEGYGLFELILLSIGDIPRIMRTLKFAIWVILILSIFTLAGAILPQEEFASSPQEFTDQYRVLFSLDEPAGQGTFGKMLYKTLVKPLQLYRIFESSHYFVLLVVLTMSAALCAWDRLKITRKLGRLTKAKTNRKAILAQPHSTEGKTGIDLEGAGKQATEYLRSKGFQVFSETKENETIWLFGRSNFFRHYASVIFHFAFVFIIAGGVLGHEKTLGYEGRIAFSEGETSLLAEDRQAEILYMEKLRNDPPPPGEEATPFTPQHDERLQLIEYENIYREIDFGSIDPVSGMPTDYDGRPSDYISHMRVIRPGADEESTETLEEKAVEVNFPLSYGKVRYYQVSTDALMFFNVHFPTGETEQVQTWLSQPFTLPGYEFDIQGYIQLNDYTGGLWEAKDGTRTELPPVVRLMDYSSPMGGVLVGYLNVGSPISVAGLTIELTEIKEYTVLQYVHDPGVPIVYFGGFLLIIGLTYVLYFPYRTIRVILESRGDATSFVVGSNASDTPENLAKALENKD